MDNRNLELASVNLPTTVAIPAVASVYHHLVYIRI